MNLWRREIWAGLTTFFTMAYIVVVNPTILSTEGTGIAFSGALTATVLVCFSMTLLMGLYAKLPFAVAPGMGINAFFTFTLVLGKGVPWPIALGAVFWSGVVFLLISVTRAREAIALAIPQGLRSAAAAGIGLFLTFIGLKSVGLVAADPVTLVKMGKIDAKIALSLAGFAFALWLHMKKKPYAFLVSILLVTLVSWLAGWTPAPERVFSAPDFESVFFKLDIWGALQVALIPAILSMLFTDLFDSISTFIGVSQSAGMLDKNGDPLRLREGLIVDSLATLSAGLFGSSAGTAYIESAAGIEAGGRTGRTAIVTALCFLPCLFIAPLARMVPPYATGMILVLVGALMFRSVRELRYDRLEDVVPAFLTIVLIPLTFSITQGILWGFIAHVTLYTVAGRRERISPVLWLIAALSVVLIWIEHTG